MINISTSAKEYRMLWIKCKCNVCQQQRSQYMMNNRFVCLRCDDLLFDIEIECEEELKPTTKETEIKNELSRTK